MEGGVAGERLLAYDLEAFEDLQGGVDRSLTHDPLELVALLLSGLQELARDGSLHALQRLREVLSRSVLHVTDRR